MDLRKSTTGRETRFTIEIFPLESALFSSHKSLCRYLCHLHQASFILNKLLQKSLWRVSFSWRWVAASAWPSTVGVASDGRTGRTQSLGWSSGAPGSWFPRSPSACTGSGWFCSSCSQHLQTHIFILKLAFGGHVFDLRWTKEIQWRELESKEV